MPAVLDDRPAHAGRLAGINDVATHLSTMSWNYTPLSYTPSATHPQLHTLSYTLVGSKLKPAILGRD